MTQPEIEKMVSHNMDGWPYSHRNIQIYYKGIECALRLHHLAEMQNDPAFAYAAPVGSAMRHHAALVAARRDVRKIRERVERE
ncbi:MAG: hypothetical protein PHX68_02320 [Alphaproteobacteria bacterium]|nr:hypothetical protein [Alphaproteobacteria bacterium]